MAREYEGSGGGLRGLGIFGLIASGIGGIIALLAVFGSFFTVAETERAVLLRNGAFSQIVQPGLSFKWPFVDSVYKVDLQTHTYTWDKMEAYSFDSQPAFLKVSVTLHLSPDRIREFYTRFGADYDAAIKRIIAPSVAQQTKIVFGQFNAERVIRNREALNEQSGKSVLEAIGNNPVFTIERVRIEDIQFSRQYIESVEARMKAEVEVQQFQQQLAREQVQAKIKVTQAQAIADSTLAQATAEAKATELRGNAEAMSIQARGEALARNPNLVTLIQSEKWNGTQPQFLSIGGSGGPVPLLNIGSPMGAPTAPVRPPVAAVPPAR